MQGKLIYFIILLVSLGCNSILDKVKTNDKTKPLTVTFNVESAIKVLEIASELSEGTTIKQSNWDELFNSQGYRNYLVYSDSTLKKKLIMEAMLTVFDPTNNKVLDSILKEPISLGASFMRLSLVQNFNELKNNLGKAETFLYNTNFVQVLASADSLAKTYIPSSLKDSIPELYPVYVVSSDPDGRVLNNSISLDLNLILQMGKEGLIELVAHEYHHIYRKLTTKEYDNALMIELNRLHQEGLADLIDKEQPPISKLGLFPISIINTYNSDYQRTPETLKTLDSLVVGYLQNEIDSAIYLKRISKYFKFGGHTTGIYMSFLIEENIGKSRLVESYNNPVEFINIYNDVARNLPDEYIFSQEFMNYINEHK